MPTIAPDKLTPAIEALLRNAAARIVMPRFRQLADDEIMEKEPGELVTIADREVERFLTPELAKIIPDAGFLGEETVSETGEMPGDLESGYWWIVDPIDGTHNFAHGNPPFAIMIALAHDGDLIGGWIYDPVADRLCHAIQSGGAYINHQSVTSKGSGRPHLQAGISTMFMDTKEAAFIERVSPGKAELVPIPRCAGEQYPRVVLGENDFALFNRVLPWDHAAGALFLTEAGGKVSRLNGDTYRFYENRHGLIAASTGDICDQALSLLDGFDDLNV